MSNCPTNVDLRHFLDEQLDAATAARLATHIDECARCQEELERLTPEFATSPHGEVALLPSDLRAHLVAHPPSHVTTVPSLPADAAALDRALPRLPGYELLGVLGRGGMGVVYKARQVTLHRLVAVKMIVAGAHADPEHLRRFQGEAEAVARLRHPHIVQVHDYGVAEDCPYLALEFVEGGTLAQKAAGVAQPPREAARIIETLATAMQHAHQQGLIHRDLKPANVLLTAEGVLKIADFGLVKQLPGGSCTAAEGPHTSSNALVGTPTYMAPEQVSGELGAIGPATDIYALGVILYELLTGRPPFQGGSVMDVLNQVKERDATPPSRLRHSVPRDLETICLKCLRKEPAQRYASAAVLADDLRRFQAGEPIAARPVGVLERAWRWTQRKPALASLAAALFLVVVFSFGTVTGLWLRAERALDQADADFQLACESIDRYAVRVSDNLRLRQEDLRPLRKELLETVVPFYERLLERHGGRADLRAERGRAYARLAEIVGDIEDLMRAGELYEQAVVMFRALADQYPGEEEYQVHLARLGTNLGSVYGRTGRNAQAEISYQESRARWHERVRQHPDAAETHLGLAHASIGLAGLWARTGRRDQALDLYRQALRIPSELEARGVRLDLAQRQVFALGHHNLGQLHLRLGQTAEAESELDRALAMQEQLAAANRQVAEHQHYLAAIQRSRAELFEAGGRLLAARSELRKALVVSETLAQQHASVHDYAESLAGCRLALAGLTASTQETSQALTEFEKVRDLLADLAQRQPRVISYRDRLARVQLHLSQCYRTIGRWDEATAEGAKALALLNDLIDQQPEVDAYHGDRCRLYAALAQIHLEGRHFGAAEAPLARALELGHALVRQYPRIGAYQHQLAHGHRLVGALRFNTGRIREVEAPLREALSLMNDLVQRYPTVLAYQIDLSRTHNSLAVHHDYVGQPAQSEDEYGRALTVMESLTEQQPEVIEYAVTLGGYLANLGLLQEKVGNSDTALETFTRAITILLPILEREPQHARVRLMLCDAYWNRAGAFGSLNCWAETVANYDHALALDDGRRQEMIRAVRADARSRTGDHARGMAEVLEVAQQKSLKYDETYYELATACCAAVEAVQAESTLSAAERDRRANEYAAQGVTLLVRGEAAGLFKDIKYLEKLKTDPYLNQLRSRSDFQRFLATLDASTNRKDP